MFKESFIQTNHSHNEKYIDNFMRKISLNMCCNTCLTDLTNYKILNQNNIMENIFKNDDMNKFEIEFIPIGMIKKSKGRRKWSKDHDRVLDLCIKLFGKNISKIKLFLNEFTDNHIEGKINNLIHKKNKNLSNKLKRHVSFTTNNTIEQENNDEDLSELDKFETIKPDIFNFSIEKFLLINKIENKIIIEDKSKEIKKGSLKLLDVSFSSELQDIDNKKVIEHIYYDNNLIDRNLSLILNDSTPISLTSKNNTLLNFDDFFNNNVK